MTLGASGPKRRTRRRCFEPALGLDSRTAAEFAPSARRASRTDDTAEPETPFSRTSILSDLNNANPHPPEDSLARLKKAEEESRKLDSPQRKNDSTINPEESKEDALKGFHGG